MGRGVVCVSNSFRICIDLDGIQHSGIPDINALTLTADASAFDDTHVSDVP